LILTDKNIHGIKRKGGDLIASLPRP